MKRVQVMCLITDTVHHDEVVAEHVNVRLLPGGRAYVKTAGQSVFYAAAARIVIDRDYAGDARPLVRSDVVDESVAGQPLPSGDTP